MKSGTFLGVAATVGAMLATDAQAAQGEQMRGAGATRVDAIRSMNMDGFRASDIEGFRGARTMSRPRFVSERRVIRSRPVAYRSRSEFIRPARRVVRSELVRPVAYRRTIVRERMTKPRFVTTRRVVAARPVAYRTRTEFIRPARRLVRSGFVRPVAHRRTIVRERIVQPRVVTTRRLVAARPVMYRSDAEFLRPARRVVRTEILRPVTFRRGVAMRERRLSSLRFADRDRVIVRRSFPSTTLVSSAGAPAYYSPSSYYSPTTYNYPAEYYTPATSYTTVQTVPRYTFALAGTSPVLSVQTELARLGYYDGPLDGLMGPMTRSAILQYERDYGLPRFSTISRSLMMSLGLL